MEKNHLNELGVQIDIMEGIYEFLEDLNEQYSAYGIGNNSKQFHSATLKLITLTGFMRRNLDDMHVTLRELHNREMGGMENDSHN